MTASSLSEIPSAQTIEEAISYRCPMAVSGIRVYHGAEPYPVCPRCQVTLDREYVNFCDRCGQKLSWRTYRRAEIAYR